MALVPVKNVGQFGMNKDLSQHELPINAWTDCENVRFLDGYANQFLGYGEVYQSPPAIPQYLLPCNVAGSRYWVYATAANQYAVTITGGVATHTDITHLTSRTGVANLWTGSLLSGVPILNAGDGATPPMAWDLNLTHKFVDLTAWPASTYCKSIRAYKNFLIALNITKGSSNYPYMVKWSHPADPGSLPASWDQTDPTKQAGEADIADGYDKIIDGMQLRDFFMIYKENSIYRMDFVGGNYVFKFTKVLGTSGALNCNCIADIDGQHVALTSNDIIIHDGNQATSILDKMTRRWLFQNMDATNYTMAFVFANPFFNEVNICYPSVGSSYCDKAIVYNYKDNTISQRDMPNALCGAYGPVNNGLTGAWNADSAPWPTDLTLWDGPDFVPSSARCLIGSNNQKLYLLDSSSAYDGLIPNAKLERVGLSFDVPESIKLIRGIRPRITGNTGDTVIISVGTQPDPWSTPVYTDMTHTIGSTIANDCLVSGRYIAIKFSTGTAYQWRLDSFDIDVQTGGLW
jgi:hypothetical protein